VTYFTEFSIFFRVAVTKKLIVILCGYGNLCNHALETSNRSSNCGPRLRGN